MFDDIGRKIKVISMFNAVIGAIAFFIAAIVMFWKAYDSYYSSEESIYICLGLAFLILGPLFSWLSSVFIYGFGELIESTTAIEFKMNNSKVSDAQAKIDNERIEKLNKLRTQNLISEEEYISAINKECGDGNEEKM